jgi:DNA-directed RNA polymerase alpha subunit
MQEIAIKYIVIIGNLADYLKATRILSEKLRTSSKEWEAIDALFLSEDGEQLNLSICDSLIITKENKQIHFTTSLSHACDLSQCEIVEVNNLHLLSQFSWVVGIGVTQYAALLDTNLEDLEAFIGCEGLYKRTYNALRSIGINKVSDLIQYSAKELLKIRKFGEACLSIVESILAELGLALKKEE